MALIRLFLVFGSFASLAASRQEQLVFDEADTIPNERQRKTTTLEYLNMHLLEQAQLHPERYCLKALAPSSPSDLKTDGIFDSIAPSPSDFLKSRPVFVAPKPVAKRNSISSVEFEETIDRLEVEILGLEKKEKTLHAKKQSLLRDLLKNQELLYALKCPTTTEEESAYAIAVEQSAHITKKQEKYRLKHNKVCTAFQQALEKAKEEKAKLNQSQSVSISSKHLLESRLNILIQKRSGPPSILRTPTPQASPIVLKGKSKRRRVSFNSQVFRSPIVLREYDNDEDEACLLPDRN